MKIIKTKDQRNKSTIDKLAEEVRSAAYESATALWSAFLEVGELDAVHATEKALRLLVSHGDCTGAMKMLEGIYALVEIAPPEDFNDCQKYLTLAQMFMEEFLAESEDFIFDAGMEDVLALLMGEGQ